MTAPTPPPPPPRSGSAGSTTAGSTVEREASDPLKEPALRRVLLRSFLIQGSWNYRTMIGGGVAWSLAPWLRALHVDDEARQEEAIVRHAEHFNAHPYLAPIALGAVARMERDGERPEQIHRFKMAVRGPLGSLGDALVWAGWLPVSLCVGLALAFLGAPPLVAVVVFLLLFNAGHVLLRIWGFRMGFRRGRFVGDGLRSAGFAAKMGRISAAGALLLGVLVGVLAVRGLGEGRAAWPWLVAATLTFSLGYAYGQRVRRAETFVFMLVMSAFFLIGTFL